MQYFSSQAICILLDSQEIKENGCVVGEIKPRKINVWIWLDEISKIVSDRMMSNVFVPEPNCRELKGARYICLIYTEKILTTVNEFRSWTKDIMHILPS